MKLEILGTTIKLLFEIGKWIVHEIRISMSGERGYAVQVMSENITWLTWWRKQAYRSTLSFEVYLSNKFRWKLIGNFEKHALMRRFVLYLEFCIAKQDVDRLMRIRSIRISI